MDLTEKIWREVLKWFKNELRPFLAKEPLEAKGSWRIETLTNSVLECKSADSKGGLIGEGLDLLLIDEATRVKESVWAEELRPTLSDRQGKAVLISTPRGRNWYYREFLKGRSRENGYSCYQLASNLNPYFPREEWEALKKEFGEDSPVFKQEFLAEFLDDIGAVFRNIRACIGGELQEPRASTRYVIGADLAKSQDYTVLCVMEKATRQVVHFDRFRDLTYDMQMPRIVNLSKRYNGALVLLDSTGVGDPVYDVLATTGCNVRPYKFTNPSKEVLIRGLMIALENKNISYPYLEPLINELEAFEYKIGTTGVMRYGAPEGLHDDCVISLSLAVEALREDSFGLIEYTKDLINEKEVTSGNLQDLVGRLTY